MISCEKQVLNVNVKAGVLDCSTLTIVFMSKSYLDF